MNYDAYKLDSNDPPYVNLCHCCEDNEPTETVHYGAHTVKVCEHCYDGIADKDNYAGTEFGKRIKEYEI